MVTRGKKGNNYSWMCKMLPNVGSTILLIQKNSYGNSRYLQFSKFIGLFGYALVMKWLFVVNRSDFCYIRVVTSQMTSSCLI